LGKLDQLVPKVKQGLQDLREKLVQLAPREKRDLKEKLARKERRVPQVLGILLKESTVTGMLTTTLAMLSLI
jgi:hypothetical protein